MEWLGWDLVEPVTFSIGQGSFVAGLIFIMRNRNAGIEYSELQDHYMQQKKEKEWLLKHNFDIKRHQFLKTKLMRIDEKLKLVED